MYNYIFVLLLQMTSVSWSHPIDHSLIELDISTDQVIAEVRIPMGDFQEASQLSVRGKTIQEIQSHQSIYLDYIFSHLDIYQSPDQPWKKTANGDIQLDSTHNKIPDLLFKISFQPDGPLPTAFTVRSDLVTHQVITHKVFLGLRSDWQAGILSDQKRILTAFNQDRKEFQVQRQEGGLWTGFLGTLNLGLKHIYEGFDHILFLVMLVMSLSYVQPHRQWLKKLLFLVSSFTLGHTLSLFYAGTVYSPVSTQVIECLVAFTIIVTCIHVIRPIIANKEWLVSLAFGLIHGLAFSEIVGEFHLSQQLLILSILGFNIGVELMQILLIGMIVPWLVWLAKVGQFAMVKKTFALVGLILSICWFVERALNVEVLKLEDKLMINPFWVFYLLLVMFSVTLGMRKITFLQRNVE